jgi:hypothetical protein
MCNWTGLVKSPLPTDRFFIGNTLNIHPPPSEHWYRAIFDEQWTISRKKFCISGIQLYSTRKEGGSRKLHFVANSPNRHLISAKLATRIHCLNKVQ